MSDRYCPCNGACHYGSDNPCSIDCFAHHKAMARNDDGWDHALRIPNGECRADCPHPSHATSGDAGAADPPTAPAGQGL